MTPNSAPRRLALEAAAALLDAAVMAGSVPAGAAGAGIAWLPVSL